MNRFIIEDNPVGCAQSLCDSHVIKMVLEEGQMLSTVHRLVDGAEYTGKTKTGRNKKAWKIVYGVAQSQREDTLYKACHYNHPCTIWSRETRGNYEWSFKLFEAIAREYTHRYEKTHKTYQALAKYLYWPPANIDPSAEVTPFPLAMGAAPECINTDDPIQSYRDFYHTKQQRFKMVWSHRDPPSWWKATGSSDV